MILHLLSVSETMYVAISLDADTISMQMTQTPRQFYLDADTISMQITQNPRHSCHAKMETKTK